MAKRRQQDLRRPPKGFGRKNPTSELRQADSLIQQQAWQEAQEFLTDLLQDYPNHVEILKRLMRVSYKLRDFPRSIDIGERLLELDPHDVDVAYDLAIAYTHAGMVVTAQRAFQQLVERWPNSNQAMRVKPKLHELEPIRDESVANLGVSGEEGIELARLHERGTLYVDQQKYQQAQEIHEELLRRKPDFVAARNNLSLIHFSQDQTTSAIQVAEQALTQDPENLHALSNLVRFCFISGQIESAQGYAQRLKTTQVSAPDQWLKQAAALSCLGEDQGVVELWEAAKAANALKDLPGFFYHLVAVALARLGREQLARKQWDRALERQPNFSLVEENLKDLNAPPGNRLGAWPYGLSFWLTPSLQQRLISLVDQDDEEMTATFQQIQSEYPYILHLFRVLLERGDQVARYLLVYLARRIASPELLEILRDFAFSPWGPDELRYKAATCVYRHGLIDSDRVSFWFEGKEQEIILLPYEFTDQPVTRHSRQVEAWQNRAIQLLSQGDAQAAEQLLLKADQADPQSPDIQNNLAMSYRLQGRSEEANQITQRLVEEFPDYLYPRLDLANQYVHHRELEKAEELLDPILKRQQFHFNEFANLSQSYLVLCAARNDQATSMAWLRAWQLIDPEGMKSMTERMRNYAYREKPRSLIDDL